MGIFGFGVLRDRFASVVPPAAIVRTGYVACFDVTPIVVYAIRHSTEENEFVELFRRRMESSKEVRFLRTNPPYALCYTLDNRAPLAKRQTQIQRLLDARPIVARLTTTTAAVTTVGTTADGNNFAARGGVFSPSPLRVKDVAFRIREILLRDFVLTSVETATTTTTRRRFYGNGGSSDSKNADDCAKRSKLARCSHPAAAAVTAIAIDDKKTDRRASCRDDDDSTSFARMNRIEFDYDEGEGEIKAMNWLSEHGGGKKGRLRLIMARDNDVFVYILSKLSGTVPLSPSLPSSQRLESSSSMAAASVVGSWRLRYRDERNRRRCAIKVNSAVVDSIELDSYLMYHEGSNDVLLCWRHLSAYYDKCWILLLWMSVCFGNDFAFGILDKSVTSVSYYYPLLERHFINVNASFAALNYTDDDNGGCGDRSEMTTRKTTTIVTYLTKAFCELRKVLLPPGRHFDDDMTTASMSESSSDDDSDDKTVDDGYDDYVRLWIARQLWSFFYILELPSEFTKNQRFSTCPTLRINASFDKPYMSNERFVRLRDIDFRRHIESVVLNGL